MKTLYESLYENLEEFNFDDFDREFLKHLIIDYSLHYPFIYEDLLTEKYGIYNGLEELCETVNVELLNHLNNYEKQFHLVFNRNELKDIPNVFFDRLIIYIDMTRKNGGALNEPKSLNKETLLFDTLEVFILPNSSDEIIGILKHEMTHAFRKYNILLNNKSFIDWFDLGIYQKISTMTKEIAKDDLRRILYFTLGYERNSFIAQLTDELRIQKAKVNTPMDALKVLKSTSIYNTYKMFLKKIVMYKRGILSKKATEEFVKEYNNISGTEYQPVKVFKKLEYLAQKSMKKLNGIIGRLCLKYLDNPNIHIDCMKWLE